MKFGIMMTNRSSSHISININTNSHARTHAYIYIFSLMTHQENAIRFDCRIIIQGRIVWLTTWETVSNGKCVTQSWCCNEYNFVINFQEGMYRVWNWLAEWTSEFNLIQRMKTHIPNDVVREKEKNRIHDGRVVCYTLFVYQKSSHPPMPALKFPKHTHTNRNDSVDLSSACWIAMLAMVLCVIPKCFF